MPESFKTRWMRRYFNWFPAYRGTGARVIYIAADWKEIRIQLPLSWRTRNYVGVIYGGSIYAAADPMYMIMLIKLLGTEYIVWDKAASIQFKKPGRSTLYATFKLDDAELDNIRAGLETQSRMDRVYDVEWVDREGVIIAKVEKTIHIRKKERKD